MNKYLFITLIETLDNKGYDKGEGEGERASMVKHRKFIKNRCLYQCPYYQDGSVSSLCNKYGNRALAYDGKPLPLRRKECILDSNRLTLTAKSRRRFAKSLCSLKEGSNVVQNI